MAGRNVDEKLRCSFCNKTQDQVKKLIAGPNGAYICDECVGICADILDEEFENEEDIQEDAEGMNINLLKPKEIKEFLDDYVIGQDEAKKVLSVAVDNLKCSFLLRNIILIYILDGSRPVLCCSCARKKERPRFFSTT